jgi:hypothetical protein
MKTRSPTPKVLAGTLARVKALGDDHSQRLQRIEQNLNGQSTRLDRMDACVEKVDGRLDRIERDIKGLREEIPGLVINAVRNGLRDRG